MQVPSSAEQWTRLAADFYNRWNLPNCIGAIDGKHIQIKAPNQGSEYFNYMGFQSIILLALVDANYCITYFDVGTNGRAGDASVFRESSLGKRLERNELGIPGPRPLPSSNDPLPFFIVGDDAFPLKPYLLKPYPAKKIGDMADLEQERRMERIFNYRLSRARRISENVFGILAARFGVFRTPIHLSPDNAVIVTKACLALHNFCQRQKDKNFVPPSLIDNEDPVSHIMVPGEWRRNTNNHLANIVQQSGNRNAANARWVRDKLKEYVNGVGKVPWQEGIVFGKRK